MSLEHGNVSSGLENTLPGPGFAVIDLETTGLFPGAHERILELAVVHVDEFGAITGEWETLINPRRHVGAEHVHGIRAVDLIDAPTFLEIAGDLVDLIAGRVLVAHNARFDRGFLVAEFGHAALPLPDDAPFLCTMQLARDLIPGAGRSLADCCAAFDILLDDAHRASADARATAELLGGYIASTDREYWHPHLAGATNIAWPAPVHIGSAQRERWVARSAGRTSMPFLQRIALQLPDVSGPLEHVEYLALLDRCLIDRHLSEHEMRQLVALADELSIGRDTASRLHTDYFDQLAKVAWSDGLLAASEVADLMAVAALLKVPESLLVAALEPRAPAEEECEATSPDLATGAFVLPPEALVVLTGEMSRSRADIEAALAAAGYRVANAVSKRVSLVVAADPDSLSGKARKAREYGIPVVSEAYLAGMGI